MSLLELDKIFNSFKKVYFEEVLNSKKSNLFYGKPLNIGNHDFLHYYNEIKRILNKKYGVIGGGIGLLSVVKQKPILLFGRNLKKKLFNEPTENIEILDFEYPSFYHKELINLSFFASRETQIPEYLKLLNAKSVIQDKIINKKFLKENKYIWITNEEIKTVLDIYHQDVANIFYKKNIIDANSFFSLSMEDKLEIPEFLLANKIYKSKSKLKKELINSLDYYIAEINKLNFEYTNKNYTDSLNDIVSLHSSSTFPILSYSLIYLLSEYKTPKYSHIIFPVWNAYSYYHAYKVKSNIDNYVEYSLIHGLYTIDENLPNLVLNENLLIEFKLIIKQFIEPIIDKEHYQKIKSNDLNKIEKQAIRNAISKVMVRNLSHNLGSHVLSRLVQPSSVEISKIISPKNLHYTSIIEKIKGQNKQNIWENATKRLRNEYWIGKEHLAKNKRFKEEIDKFLKKEAAKDYYNDLISYFNSYLKTRQDLLAGIVSNVPQVQNSKWFVDELMMGIDKNRLLLNRISGIEDFTFKFTFKGLICHCLDICSNCKGRKDIQVAVSNDILGQHAFYIILENIIRNTAKHGQQSNFSKSHQKEHIFSIELNESQSDNSYYQIDIYDNVEIEGYSYLQINQSNRPITVVPQSIDIGLIEEHIIEVKDDYQQYYLLRLGYNTFYSGSDSSFDYYRISNIDRLIIHQNIWINEPILNSETFDLRQGALGLIEMEVCAAYLRRVPIEEIEAPQFDLKFDEQEIKTTKEAIKLGKTSPRLLRAVKKNENIDKNTGSLGYRFYIPKPKEVLIIDEVGELWKTVVQTGTDENKFHQLKELEKHGVLLLNAKEDYVEDEWQHWRFNPKSIYQHALLVFIKDENTNKKYVYSNLPKRRIEYNKLTVFFNKFEYKHQEKIAEFEEYIADGGYSDWQKYQISLDVLTAPKEFIIEAWRAYVSMKLDNKKLSLGLHDEIINNNSHEVMYHPQFDHHGHEYHNWSKNWDKGLKIGDYNEIYSSQFKDRYVDIIDNPIDVPSNLKLKLQFLEASLSNIIILDERIQEQAYSQEYKLEGGPKLKLAAIWNHVNVYIPSAEKDNLNLGKKNFSATYKQQIRKIIEEQFGEQSFRKCKGIDFIVIHLGVIEKVLEQTPNKSKDNPNHIIEFVKDISTYGGHKAEVILTSGRAPSNLSEEMSFLSYSVISQHLIENRFKVLLNEVLNAARPKLNQ